MRGQLTQPCRNYCYSYAPSKHPRDEHKTKKQKLIIRGMKMTSTLSITMSLHWMILRLKNLKYSYQLCISNLEKHTIVVGARTRVGKVLLIIPRQRQPASSFHANHVYIENTCMSYIDIENVLDHTKQEILTRNGTW